MPDESRRTDAAVREIPPAPDGLDEIEAEAWEELRGVVNGLRTATSADMVAFLVDALAIARRAAAVLREEGLTVSETGVKGQVYARVRPEVSAALAAQKVVWYGLSRFGCSPADRSRVSAFRDASTADPYAEFCVG